VSVVEMPLEEMRAYAPALVEPADLDEFWARTLAVTRGHPLDASFDPVETGLTVIESWDVAFRGFDGAPIRGWLHLPRGRRGPLPVVVEYIGYGGGRGLAHERILFAAAGMGHFVMDTRGQGSTWMVGDTPDPGAGTGPAHPGFMTDGILDPGTYYYRRVFTDAVRAIEAVRTHPGVDPLRVAVTGVSQGGGITLAVSGLVTGLVAVAPDVPFLCDLPRAIRIAETDPYAEIRRYLAAHRDHVDDVHRTLGYFDAASLCRRATAPALFSVALMDATCPPSTVYAAFNCYGGPRRIVEYPFNDHEGGQAFQDVAKLRWLAERLSTTDGQSS
jgi:cephalosporin-C deacetylase